MTTAIPTEARRDRTAVVARALADPKRLCVLEYLADGGERSVGDLSRCVGCHVPNMSQHLAIMRSAGIVASRREGSTVLYRIADRSVLDLVGALQRVAG
ncbi:MAG: ArsR/SmtB family transcription factor [Candidatus Limnocylindria bacterium]